MAIEGSELISDENTSNETQYVTAAFSPAANNLVLAAIYSKGASGSLPTLPTLTGNDLTYSTVTTVLTDTSNNTGRLTVFRAMGASPSNSVLTIDGFSPAQLECSWTISEYTGVDTSGSNGAGATNDEANVGVTNPGGNQSRATVTLSSFEDATNHVTYAAFANTGDRTMMLESGFTYYSDTPPSFTVSGWKTGEDTDSFCTMDDTSLMVGVAFEVFDPAAAAASVYTLLPEHIDWFEFEGVK